MQIEVNLHFQKLHVMLLITHIRLLPLANQLKGLE